MAHQLFSLPKQTAISSNLTLLPGAKVEFFLTTTTTPTPVYTTSALSTQHTNPVVADSAGRLPAIYLDPSIVYRITFKDSAGAEIYPAVDPVNDQLLSQAIIGGYLYPRTQPEIDALVTPVNYAYPPGNILRYGTNTTPGTTDMTSAIQNALNANSGAAVFFPAGTYKILGQITVPVDTDIIVQNGGVVTLAAGSADLSAATALILCEGSIGSALGGGLASTVSAGAVSLTLNSAPSLSPGDLCILRNTANASWNGDSAGNRQGEFLVVKSASGAVVVFTSAVIDSYASTVTCGLYKVTPTTTRIKGKLTIIGNTADTSNVPTVYFHYGRDNVVDGLVFRTTTSTCIEFNVCYKPKVTDVDTGKYLTDAGSIQSTGVVLASCQYGSVMDSILAGDRHGASTGGGGTVVDRFNVFSHCAISSRTSAAADFHGNAEFCEYRNCHIDGGINLSGARNKIVECKVYPHASVTSLINMEANKSIDHEIVRSRFHMIGGVVRYLIDANASTDINANTGAGELLIDDIDLFDDTALDQTYIFLRNNGS
ncbi:MAG TPA: glycosyl hydrolase family 28-related protein, partial [Anaerolineae bacterium]